jgi:hypothetical protein
LFCGGRHLRRRGVAGRGERAIVKCGQANAGEKRCEENSGGDKYKI